MYIIFGVYSQNLAIPSLVCMIDRKATFSTWNDNLSLWLLHHKIEGQMKTCIIPKFGKCRTDENYIILKLENVGPMENYIILKSENAGTDENYIIPESLSFNLYRKSQYKKKTWLNKTQ